MKSLLMSDLHTNWNRAQEIIDANPDVDEVVLLGDYFDEFYDTVTINEDMARWLSKFITAPNHIVIYGNHDLSYQVPVGLGKDNYRCSGYTRSKNEAINNIMSAHWADVRPYYMCQGWLCTHAGLSETMLASCKMQKWNIAEFEQAVKDALRDKDVGRTHPLFDVGYARGGYRRCGGITWCDFNEEFAQVKGLKQVFGHTPGDTVRKLGPNNYCIDTHLESYIIIEDGKVNIK